MKPLRIEFEAFGSYPGKVDVDFQQLAPRGLFVITGATGTGKTTIFDAMAYALYGEMPQKESNDIRSHHAAPDAPTWVRFTFEVDGTVYVAERSPDYQRARKIGTGLTSEKAAALITRLEPDGMTRPIATKIRDAKSACTTLLGLSLEQFSKVMLLPQGSITRFLLDGSNEREELLGQLFGGEVYERVVQRLKIESDAAKAEVGRVDEEERHLLSNARSALRDIFELIELEPPDELESLDGARLTELFAETQPAQAQLTDKAKAATQLANDAERLHQDGETSARRFDDVVRLREQRDLLDQAAPAIVAAERSALRSLAARPVVAAASDADDADVDLNRRTAARNERCADLTAIASAVDVALDTASAASVVRSLGDAVAETSRKQRLIQGRIDAQTVVDSTEASVNATSAELEQIDADITRIEHDLGLTDESITEIEPQRRNLVELDTLTDRLRRAQQDHQRLTQHQRDRDDRSLELQKASSRLNEMWQRFVATQAPRLATELREGSPCPVCGACEHPNPALDLDGDAVSFDDVQRCQSEVDQLSEAVREIDARIVNDRLELGELAALTAAELALQLDEHTAAASEARHVEGRYAELVALRTSTADLLTDRRQDRAAAASRLDGLRELQARHVDDLTAARHECLGIDDEDVARTAAELERCRLLVVGIDSIFGDVTEAETRVTERRAAASRLLGSSEFASFEEALSACVDVPDEERWINEAVTHRDRYTQIGTTLETLIAQGVPDERPDTEVLRAAAETARRSADALTARHTTLEVRAHDCSGALSRWERVVTDSTDVRRRADVARRAYQVCAGQGSVRINLRRWVLANELDRVSNAATVHLGRMTGGRYGIRRLREARDAKTVAGLDLEILDAYTGRPRHPRSLSGGEQFQASLALALGLADVVSMGGSGSGRRMEALFVDEGFGSLDPKALDDAIETLHQLHATGRMVGAITHVETMKERLHVGIAVEALEGGRGSKLTVIP